MRCIIAISLLDSVSGIQNKGKFLALTEQGTTSSSGEKTGIDHLKELGITHVHLLPSYDYAPRWMKQNWTRPNIIGGMIRKITMCLTVLILQILINLMSVSGNSNKWYKLYIRRESEWCLMWCIITPSIQTKAISNVRFPVISIARRRTGNGQMVRCGNETASDRAMMRKYMIESILYWINEYHIDGFRFDLMGDIRY